MRQTGSRAAALLFLLAGCDAPVDTSPDTVRLVGSIHGNRGTQSRFAGPGTPSKATSVTVSTFAGGTWTTAGSGPVRSDGRYDLQVAVPASGFARVDALDLDGAVVGSVLVEPVAGPRVATPLSTETSVEAALFDTLDGDADLWADIRILVDADTATEIATGGDTDGDLQVLGRALATRRAAQLHAWRLAGIDTERLDEHRLQATVTLSHALASDTDGHPLLIDDLLQAELGLGATEDDLIVAHGAGNAALRAVLGASGASALLDTTSDASARIEARVWTLATPALLSGARAPWVEQGSSLADDLETDLREADGAFEVQEAVTTWRTGLLGSSYQRGLVGLAFDLDEDQRETLHDATTEARAASRELALALVTDAGNTSPQGIEALGTAVTTRWLQDRAVLDDAFDATFSDDPEVCAAAGIAAAVHRSFLTPPMTPRPRVDE